MAIMTFKAYQDAVDAVVIGYESNGRPIGVRRTNTFEEVRVAREGGARIEYARKGCDNWKSFPLLYILPTDFEAFEFRIAEPAKQPSAHSLAEDIEAEKVAACTQALNATADLAPRDVDAIADGMAKPVVLGVDMGAGDDKTAVAEFRALVESLDIPAIPTVFQDFGKVKPASLGAEALTEAELDVVYANVEKQLGITHHKATAGLTREWSFPGTPGARLQSVHLQSLEVQEGWWK